MFAPEDPLSPPKPFFDEAWQAQALALADSMVKAGYFTATDWAEALGSALSAAEARNAPDTLETYYIAVLVAIEQMSAEHVKITAEEQLQRRSDWEAAYHRTPHGQPVEL